MTGTWWAVVAVVAVIVVCSAAFCLLLARQFRKPKDRTIRFPLRDGVDEHATTTPLDVQRLRRIAAADARHGAEQTPLLVELYRAQLFYRFGDDVFAGAPAEPSREDLCR